MSVQGHKLQAPVQGHAGNNTCPAGVSGAWVGVKFIRLVPPCPGPADSPFRGTPPGQKKLVCMPQSLLLYWVGGWDVKKAAVLHWKQGKSFLMHMQGGCRSCQEVTAGGRRTHGFMRRCRGLQQSEISQQPPAGWPKSKYSIYHRRQGRVDACQPYISSGLKGAVLGTPQAASPSVSHCSLGQGGTWDSTTPGKHPSPGKTDSGHCPAALHFTVLSLI